MSLLPFLLGALLLPAPAQESKPAPTRKERKEERKKDEEERRKKEEEKVFAIVGGDVHTVGGATIRGGTVLCRGRKIWKVGLDLEVPKGAKVLDAKGMRVYPGLVAAGSAGILGSPFGGPGGNPADSVDPFSLPIQLAAASGVTTVCAGIAVGKVIPGEIEGVLVRETAFVSLAYSASNPVQRLEVREKLEKARDYLRRMREWEEAKKADPQAKEPSKQGVDESHLKLLRRELPARLPAGSADDLLAICGLLDDFGFDAVVDGAHEGWTIAPEISRRGIRCVVTPRAKVRPDRNTNRPTGSSIENAAILHGAGVPIAVLPPTSMVSTGGVAGRDLMTLPLDAAFAMRGGLGEQAALESVTLGAARVLGVEDRLGSIDPGKDADLIVTSGDLLDHRTFVEFTIVNGKVVYDRQKSTFFSHIRPRAPLELVEVGAESRPSTAPAEGEAK
ncbi:MAG: amidohydrolase family protein [Planctomycetes bacterium]|nr:amidohydrolase family protein [Planctomycetota bacterium]